MAIFEPAYEDTLEVEQFAWTNLATDMGGETFAGISRRWWPGEAVWPILDRHKHAGRLVVRELPEAVQAELAGAVQAFYRRQFWHPICGDQIASQAVAGELFDSAVNMGVRDAVRILQRALNALSGADRSWFGGPWRPLVTDGAMGPNTLAMIDQAQRRGLVAEVVETQNGLQVAHYVRETERNGMQRANFKGWLRKRVGVRELAA